MGFRKGRQYAITWCKKAENYSYVKALECYDEAIKRDPTFAEPWYGKGKIFADTPELPQNWMWHDTISPYITGIEPPPYPEVGSQTASKYQETLKLFDKATELDPKSVDAWFAKGDFYSKYNHRETPSIQCFDNVIALDSKYEPAWYGKAEALAKLGKHEEVIKCCDKAIALLPADAKARNTDDNNYYFSSRWRIKANALSELGKHKEAIKCYDEALKIGSTKHGGSAHTLSQKGLTLAKLGKHKEAIKCYDEAIPMLDYGYEEQEEINLAKADALSELGEGVSDETSMFKCYSSAIRFYTDKLFDDKHKPIVDIDDWEEGLEKLQEICSRAMNGFRKYYHYDEEDN